MCVLRISVPCCLSVRVKFQVKNQVYILYLLLDTPFFYIQLSVSEHVTYLQGALTKVH